MIDNPQMLFPSNATSQYGTGFEYLILEKTVDSKECNLERLSYNRGKSKEE